MSMVREMLEKCWWAILVSNIKQTDYCEDHFYIRTAGHREIDLEFSQMSYTVWFRIHGLELTVGCNVALLKAF